MTTSLFANFAESTLSGALTDSALSLTVQSSDASKFPSPTGTDYFLCTIFDGVNNPEIIKITARSSNTFTIQRAQESSTARSWNTGARIRLAPTAALYTAVAGMASFSTVANGSILAKNATTGLIVAAPGLSHNNTNTFIDDSLVIFRDNSDNTKRLQFQLSGITTATTRTLTIPDLNGTIALMGVSNVGNFTALGTVGIGVAAGTRPLNILASDALTTGTVLVEQASTGDASIQFLITGVSNFGLGIDNSDSDKFKIGRGSGVGTNDDFVIDSSGDLAFGGHVSLASGKDLSLTAGRVTVGGITDSNNDGLRVGANGSSYLHNISQSTDALVINQYNGSAWSTKLTMAAGGDVTLAGTVTVQGATGAAPFTITNAAAPELRITDTTTPVTLQLLADDSSAYVGALTAHNLLLRSRGLTVAQLTTQGATDVNYLRVRSSPTGGNVDLLATGSDADVSLYLLSSGGDPILLGTNGGTVQFSVSHTASAVNYLQATGGATGGNAKLHATGSDSDVFAAYIAKGSGGHIFATNADENNRQLMITHTASASNYITLTGSNGSEPLITTSGSGLNLYSNSGRVTFGKGISSNYVLIDGGGGNNPVLSTNDANLQLMTGSAIATNATAGMILIPAMSGTPSGAPTGAGAGAIPMVYDTSAHKIWFYSGSWRGVTVT